MKRKKNGLESNILTLSKKDESEREECNQLQAHFQKNDINLQIRKEDELILKKVLEMELKAEDILNFGAVSLQRIYRGIKDREIVTKLRQNQNKKKIRNEKRTEGNPKSPRRSKSMQFYSIKIISNALMYFQF